MKFTIHPLPQEFVYREPGSRPLKLTVGVSENGRLIALFKSERQADAYVRRLNQIENGYRRST